MELGHVVFYILIEVAILMQIVILLSIEFFHFRFNELSLLLLQLSFDEVFKLFSVGLVVNFEAQWTLRRLILFLLLLQAIVMVRMPTLVHH